MSDNQNSGSLGHIKEDIKARLVGTWKLVGYQRQFVGEEWVRPWGEEVDGRLIYTADGYLSVQQMRLGRPNFAASEYTSGTPDEVQAAFQGYVAYAGRYRLDEAEDAVWHIIECALFPNWIGLTMKRFYQLSDHRLILSSPPPQSSTGFQARLTWERETKI